MIKVAYVLGALDRGGTETLLLDTVKQQRIDCVVVHRKQGALWQEFCQTQTPLYHFPTGPLLYISYLFRLRKLVRKEHITIIHAQLPFDGFLAYWACWGIRVQLVLSFHGYDLGYGQLARWLVRFIIKRTSLNIYVSQHLRAYYQQAYALVKETAQQVVYNGINFNKFDEISSTSIRQELTIPSQALLLGSVGNFVSVRDPLTICRGLAALKKSGADVHCLFVGACNPADPSLYEECTAYCDRHGLSSSVHFLGSRSDVSAILHELDAFVYASDHDSFGIAVVEAMAVGLPVFVNDWAVMQEITENGKRATLYKTKDIDDFTVKILHFIQEKTLYKEAAAKNAARTRNTYSIEQHIDALKAQYRSIMNTNG